MSKCPNILVTGGIIGEFLGHNFFLPFRLDKIDKCFSQDTVEEIVDTLVSFISHM